MTTLEFLRGKINGHDFPPKFDFIALRVDEVKHIITALEDKERLETEAKVRELELLVSSSAKATDQE